MRKEVLCDSSSLISFTYSCSLNLLYMLSKEYGINFLIPPGVENEIINRPLSMQMKAYRYSAVQLKRAKKEGILLRVDASTTEESKKLLNIANNIFYTTKPIHLIDLGEADMIVLAHRLNINILLMDERTTRALIEAPFSLKEHLEEELKTTVKINKDNYEFFKSYTQRMKVVRSVDIAALAYDLGYFHKRFKEDAFEAFSSLLYKLKYSGCSVSFQEIEDYLKSLKLNIPHESID